MATGMSVHVGVNRPQPAFQMTELKGCVKDAEAMRQIAKAHGFDAEPVFADENAKLEPVKQAILKAAAKLNKGDIFLFTFSGHGSTAPTAIGEDDGQDETILLHDCILIDNYIRRNLWSQFREGVRILGVADCCHGGSSLFAFNFDKIMESVTAFFASAARTITGTFAGFPADPIPAARELTENDIKRINEASPGIHNQIRTEVLAEGKDVQATLMTLAACDDFEKALDGEDNGAFTKAMLTVLREQNAPTNYDELMTRIGANLVANKITKQHPTRFPRQNPDPEFLAQTPFTI